VRVAAPRAAKTSDFGGQPRFLACDEANLVVQGARTSADVLFVTFFFCKKMPIKKNG
jgi:hypothetical protein